MTSDGSAAARAGQLGGWTRTMYSDAGLVRMEQTTSRPSGCTSNEVTYSVTMTAGAGGQVSRSMKIVDLRVSAYINHRPRRCPSKEVYGSGQRRMLGNGPDAISQPRP